MKLEWADKVKEALADLCIDCMSKEAVGDIRISTYERLTLQRKLREIIGFIDKKLAKRKGQ